MQEDRIYHSIISSLGKARKSAGLSGKVSLHFRCLLLLGSVLRLGRPCCTPVCRGTAGRGGAEWDGMGLDGMG